VALREFQVSLHDRRHTNQGMGIGKVFTTAVFSCAAKNLRGKSNWYRAPVAKNAALGRRIREDGLIRGRF
jgi:hypothetical protein